MIRRFLMSLMLVILGITAANTAFPIIASADSDAIDLSYDKCEFNGSSHASSSLGHHKMGIVGVNHDGDWEKNPCLASEIKHFDGYYLYVNTNYPSDQCHGGLDRKDAYHCGYNLGRWDVDYAASQGAYSNLWFLDVETSNTWKGGDNLNSVFLYGLGKGIQSTTSSKYIGYYSTDYQWQVITGGWPGHGIDWYATGSNGKPSSDTIHSACRSNFSGGVGVGYYQYQQDGYDQDNLC